MTTDGNSDPQGRGVLDVNQIRFIGADQASQIPTEARIGISRDVANAEPLRNPTLRTQFRNISDEFGTAIDLGETA